MLALAAITATWTGLSGSSSPPASASDAFITAPATIGAQSQAQDFRAYRATLSKIIARQAAATPTPTPSPTPTWTPSPTPTATWTPAPTPSPTPTPSASSWGGGVLTAAQVGAYWLGANGPASQEQTAECIAFFESTDNPGAPTGGLFQIQGGQPVPGDLSDPTVNAENAVFKYKADLASGGDGWNPWTTGPKCGV